MMAVCTDIDASVTVVQQTFADVGNAGDAALAGAVASCGRLRSWLAAAEAACLGEVRRRKGDAASLAAAQRAGARRAAAALKRSKLVDQLPGAGEALASGAIGEEHLDAFNSVRAGHRDALSDDAAELLAEASAVDADRFRQRLREWQLEQDRQKGESELERQRARRRGSVSTRPDDGMGIFHFELDSVRAARVRAALAKRAEQLWRDDNAASRQDGAKRRSSAQRLADAFEELTTSAGGEPGTGVGTSIMIIADVETLRRDLADGGRCELLDGTPLPVDEVRRLALTARLLPAIFDSNGQPLWLGRSARLPNSAQRAAIAARDRGCVVGGCDAPVDWCQIHHLLWWSRGGTTDLDNLATVCSHHHHLIHEDGWRLDRSAAGAFTWRPPP